MILFPQITSRLHVIDAQKDARFAFDSDKDVRNRAKHGLPLAFGEVVLANLVGEVEDTRRDYGEVRMRGYGLVDGVLCACVYTMRGETCRPISVHRTTEGDRRRWLGS